MTTRGIRYELAPATRMLWRDPDVVQFESGEQSVVVDGLEHPHGASGSPIRRATHPMRRACRRCSTSPSCGLVWPRDESVEDDRRAVAVPHLAGELAALATRLGPRAAATLQARRRRAGRGPRPRPRRSTVGARPGRGGVGDVQFTSDTDVKTWSSLPGGVLPDETGQRLASAARAAVRRATPGRASTPAARRLPDASRSSDPTSPSSRSTRRSTTSGATRCTPRDPAPAGDAAPDGRGRRPPRAAGPDRLPAVRRPAPARPRPGVAALAVQLTVARRHGPASEVAVATMSAGVAAPQALTYLDGGEPASIDGTLELHLPDWRIRRRSWPAHPDCGCGGLTAARRRASGVRAAPGARQAEWRR